MLGERRRQGELPPVVIPPQRPGVEEVEVVVEAVALDVARQEAAGMVALREAVELPRLLLRLLRPAEVVASLLPLLPLVEVEVLPPLLGQPHAPLLLQLPFCACLPLFVPLSSHHSVEHPFRDIRPRPIGSSMDSL